MTENVYINSFLKSLKTTLESMGVIEFKEGELINKEEMCIEWDLTTFTGIVGKTNGNVSYSFSKDTAKKLISLMMMGMEVNEIDDMAISALGEFANMIAGGAGTNLSLYSINIDITPPSIVIGEKMYFILSSAASKSIKVYTGIGQIEIDFGLDKF